VVSGIRGIISMLEQIPQSLISLLARVIIGLVFFKSGLTKIEGFHITDAAIFLFQEEYKLPLLSPSLAAHIAAIMELSMPLFLFAGLATRFAALALLGMTLVIELFVYPEAYVVHGLWAVALLTLIKYGAGAISLDHMIGRSLNSAGKTSLA
jgi:putative oxidoreductase